VSVEELLEFAEAEEASSISVVAMKTEEALKRIEDVLTEDQYEVVVRKAKGLTSRQIGEQLEKTPTTVRRTLMDAQPKLQKLRQELGYGD
jgi:DNA-binding NarL/FixJ family response regulator